MNILLVHPDDSVDAGPWTKTRWDLIVDLGWSGRHQYSRLASRLGCRVVGVSDLLDHLEHKCELRKLLEVGLKHLVDSESIDWWAAYSAWVYQPIEQILLCCVLADQIPENAEIFATRPHFSGEALSTLVNREIKIFLPDPLAGLTARASRFAKRTFALRPSQIIEISFDKWDTDYRLRRLFRQRIPASSQPVVLLPSSYINVSRAQLAYARMLPHRRFLLVVTRSSGRRLALPDNVEVRSLASYAPPRSASTDHECSHLRAKWQQLVEERYSTDRVLGLATKLGVFEKFPDYLRTCLRIRDAWREVATREPIAAVLSADEHNAFTRFPIILGQSRGLPTLFCDHGALNMSFAMRDLCSDTYLAAGDMASDYLVNWCGVPRDRIVVGSAQTARKILPSQTQRERDWIVYFSEAYEILPARTQVLYSEILPELCALARLTNRRVIVKLHPFESSRVRKRMIDQALSTEDRAIVDVREGTMTPDLFERAWFSVTVESSVAVESTFNGVPCFLCGWFDASWYDYGKQYVKYGAGHTLNSPEEIRQIPDRMRQIRVTEATRRGLQTLISPEDLESVLSGQRAR